MNSQDLLEKIAAQGLKQSSIQEIQSLALAFWRGGFLPDVQQFTTLDAKSRAIAGYLTEFFSGFNCLSDDQAKRLFEISQVIRNGLGEITVVGANPDETAGEWGLQENINDFLDYILEFQTRHYGLPPGNRD